MLDTETGKQVGTISGLHGTHGVALDPGGKVGYVSDGEVMPSSSSIAPTFATVATIPAGTNPDAIIYEPATKSVWAFNGRSNNITVIDAATQKVVATIPVPGKPEFAVTDGKGTVFNNIEDKNEVIRIDANSKQITATWPAVRVALRPRLRHSRPSPFPGLRRKKDGRPRLQQWKDSCHARHWRRPRCRGLERETKARLCLRRRRRSSLVVDASSADYKTIQSLPTKKSARTMAYDPATDRFYLASADFGPRPAANSRQSAPRPPMIPGSFTVIVVGR